ncbi:MAG: 2'-5' RNA ligase family protein [Mycobacterium sp.]|nr:2'-5' RNA ligase family protein [Mycobacterium sp.]
MAHSIELLLDPAGEAAVRADWQCLADAGLPSQIRVHSPTNRPHITLLAARRIGSGVDEVLRELADRLPLACVVGAPLVFGGPRLTLARSIVPSAGLLALHEVVFRLAVPYAIGEPFAHCRPGGWSPHATLGRRFTAEQIGAAMNVLTEGAGGAGTEVAAEVVGLRRWDSDQRVDHLLIG